MARFTRVLGALLVLAIVLAPGAFHGVELGGGWPASLAETWTFAGRTIRFTADLLREYSAAIVALAALVGAWAAFGIWRTGTRLHAINEAQIGATMMAAESARLAAETSQRALLHLERAYLAVRLVNFKASAIPAVPPDDVVPYLVTITFELRNRGRTRARLKRTASALCVNSARDEKGWNNYAMWLGPGDALQTVVEFRLEIPGSTLPKIGQTVPILVAFSVDYGDSLQTEYGPERSCWSISQNAATPVPDAVFEARSELVSHSS